MASYLISVTTLWITEGGAGDYPWLTDEAGATEGLGKPGRNLTFSPSSFLLPHTACQGLPGPAGPVSVAVGQLLVSAQRILPAALCLLPANSRYYLYYRCYGWGSRGTEQSVSVPAGM